MCIVENLTKIKNRIAAALIEANRSDNVRLIAVSKKQSIEKIRALFHAGQIDFGENYLQEALVKIKALQALEIQWHFIGNIQSNKAALIAENFSWVHSVSQEKIARILHESRPQELAPLNVCVQVNINEEKTKSGLNPVELENFLEIFTEFKNLRLRGLMFLPQIAAGVNHRAETYARAYTLFLRAQQSHPFLDTLSMGTSQDLEAALLAGSNLLRVGNAIFGERPKSETKVQATAPSLENHN